MLDMARQNKRKCFTLLWTLENVSYSRKTRDVIRSPTFLINELQSSKYHLDLYIFGKSDENFIDFCIKADRNNPYVICDFELALLSKDGSVLTSLKKEQCEIPADFCQFKEAKDVFAAHRSTYLSEDKLRVQFRVWKSDGEMTENVQCFARSRIHIIKQSFLWNIRDFNNIKLDEKRTYQINSVPDNEQCVTLNLFLKNPYTDEDLINIQVVAENDNINYLVLYLMPPLNSFSNVKGIQKEFFFYEKEKQKLLTLPFSKKGILANKTICIPDDVLSFRCECTFSTGYVFEEIEKVVYGNENFIISKANNHRSHKENTFSVSKRNLNEDFKSLFQENILSDIKLITSSKTYLAHKSILSARSSVFKAMFSNHMKETITECVNIDDIDSDAVYRMLQYVYTAEIEDLQWDNACELYRAADKYDIITLRNDCSACLKSKLCPTNACDVLIFADTYQDNDLKTSVQDFIFNHDIINTDEWSKLMETHLKLAADTMRLQIQRKQLGKPFLTSTHGIDGNAVVITSASPADEVSRFLNFQFGQQTSQFNFTLQAAPRNLKAGQLPRARRTTAFSYRQ